jgi:ADP-ribosyl-[dinitrogen reductase] hydrolase
MRLGLCENTKNGYAAKSKRLDGERYMLVEMALGDAYGAGWEFVTPEVAKAKGMVNDTETYYKHPEIDIGGGRYTDDTQMTICIAEALLAGGEFLPEELAPRVFDTFTRDPRKGYGSRFYELLTTVKSGEELLQRLDPNSTRSGAAMRVGPIGLYKDLKMVKRLSILQAMLTHDTPEGMGAACAVALMNHYFAYRLGPKSEVGDFICDHHQGWAWNEDWDEWVSVQGIPCAHAAITAVRRGNSLREVLRIAVSFGGDVDTVSAIAMFAASLTEMPDDLPPALYRNLEQGPYGGGYLVELDKKLLTFARAQGAKV